MVSWLASKLKVSGKVMPKFDGVKPLTGDILNMYVELKPASRGVFSNSTFLMLALLYALLRIVSELLPADAYWVPLLVT